METRTVRFSGDRDATVTPCQSADDADRFVTDLVKHGAGTEDLAVIVRNPSAVATGRRWPSGMVTAVAGVLGFVVGALVFAPWLGVAVGLLTAFVAVAAVSGQERRPVGAMQGSRYDVVTKGAAVAVADAIVGRPATP